MNTIDYIKENFNSRLLFELATTSYELRDEDLDELINILKSFNYGEQ